MRDVLFGVVGYLVGLLIVNLFINTDYTITNHRKVYKNTDSGFVLIQDTIIKDYAPIKNI